MTKFHLCRLSCALLFGAAVSALSGCSTANNAGSGPVTNDKPDSNTSSPASPFSLAAETSGLVCDGDTLWTINDSGNSPTVYQLKPDSGWLQSYATSATNQDWEALTVHQNQLVIGDIGNNSGKRDSVTLYLLDWPLRQGVINPATAIELALPAQQADLLAPYQHNRDAEALVSGPDGLLMLSKNWLADESTVYQIDMRNQQLNKLATISGLPGIVTDAAWAGEAEVYVLTGYRNLRIDGLMFALTGDYQPFLALVDREFNLLKTLPLATQGQVEGVCIDQQQQIWLSQEQSKAHPLQFWRWGAVADALK